MADFKNDFIRIHLIKSIFLLAEKIRKVTGMPEGSFIYFDKPIRTTDSDIYGHIDRFGKGNFFFKNQVLPISWNSIDGKILLDSLNEMKQNQIHVFKQIENKFYKTRPKKNVIQ